MKKKVSLIIKISPSQTVEPWRLCNLAQLLVCFHLLMTGAHLFLLSLSQRPYNLIWESKKEQGQVNSFPVKTLKSKASWNSTAVSVGLSVTSCWALLKRKQWPYLHQLLMFWYCSYTVRSFSGLGHDEQQTGPSCPNTGLQWSMGNGLFRAMMEWRRETIHNYSIWLPFDLMPINCFPLAFHHPSQNTRAHIHTHRHNVHF